MAEVLQDLELGVDDAGLVPGPWRDQDITPADLGVADPGEVDGNPVARLDGLEVVVVGLETPDANRSGPRGQLQLVTDRDPTPGQCAGDDGAGSGRSEGSIDPEPGHTAVVAPVDPVDHLVEGVPQLVDADGLGGRHPDDLGLFEEGAGDVLLDLHLGQLEQLLVDLVDLGQGDDPVAEAEQGEDAEVLLGLGFPALGPGHDEEAAVHRPDPGQHVAEEPDVAGNVDEREFLS